jgi:hypothetical protein
MENITKQLSSFFRLLMSRTLVFLNYVSFEFKRILKAYTKYIYLIFVTLIYVCEISSSHGDEYDVQSCLLGCTAV